MRRKSLSLPPQTDIGQKVRQHRRAGGMSLQEVADKAGISVSTLSKIENNIIEMSYTRMISISEALGINLTELLAGSQAASPAPSITARRSITRAGAGTVTETNNYVYEYLNTDISKKHMIPTVATVKARTLAEYGELACHKGEEFVIVLDGEVELHTEHYEPMRLSKGDAIYIDSTMPHAMLSVGKNLARILFVCTHTIGDETHASTEGAPAAGEPRKRVRNGEGRPRKNELIES